MRFITPKKMWNLIQCDIRHILPFSIFVSFLLFGCGGTIEESGHNDLSGVLRDSRGMVVEGANIFASNLTNINAVERSAITGRNGNFEIMLPDGRYLIYAEYSSMSVGSIEINLKGSPLDIGSVPLDLDFYVDIKNWFKDVDGDFYSDGTINTSKFRPSGFLLQSELRGIEIDCHDGNPNIYPGADETSILFDNSCDSYDTNLALATTISGAFNDQGYFGDASDLEDISYQESVTYLSLVNKYYGDIISVDDLGDSIIWSFNTLRDSEGGLKQNGVVSGVVRTSLYLFSVSNACMIDSRLLEVCNTLAEELLSSARWVSAANREWFGNHDLAALLMFYRLFQLTDNQDYFDMYAEKRSQLLAGFVHIDSDNGYWPEAPTHWANRLLTEYLGLQIMLSGYYLVLNPDDQEFSALIKKEVNVFSSYANMSKLELDVSDSYAFPQNYSSDTLPLGSPSVAWFSCLHADIYCELLSDPAFLGLYVENMLLNFDRDNQVTLFTDSFLRYGVIEELSYLLQVDRENQSLLQ